jgi:hypothetical protein
MASPRRTSSTALASIVRNTTGVIGVARMKERTRSGKWMVRYVAQWPKRNGKRGKASFSVPLYGENYGENEAFRLAVASRRAGLRDFNARDSEADMSCDTQVAHCGLPQRAFSVSHLRNCSILCNSEMIRIFSK